MKYQIDKLLFFSVCLLILLNFFVWKEVFSFDGLLHVVFFDIGQGDSIFFETPLHHQVLIDGGPSDKVLERLAREMPFWDRSIDLIVLTHPDYDHVRGFLDVLDRYKVDNILWTGGIKETKTFDVWQEKIIQEETNIYIAKKGDIIHFNEAYLSILYPFSSLLGVNIEKGSNETSIVAKLVFKENSFLFTGDISKKQELLLEDVESDVLKVAHHGSKNATSLEFLREVDPYFAIISCGRDNSYGHPHERVLSNLKEFGIVVLRTDKVGNINIAANGSDLKYEGH